MKFSQTSNQILMVRPACFGFNPETAASNSFQKTSDGMTAEAISAQAIEEFDAVVDTLMACQIDVFVVEDTPQPPKTDAVFPNNWVSFHQSGIAVTYPMMSENRRHEVREDVLEDLVEHFAIDEVWRMERESGDACLEGTGSMVLDRQKRIAYACRSPRTDEGLFNQFCQRLDYQPFLFDAVYSDGIPVYHTNVIMTVTEKLMIVCLESIADETQREELKKTALDSGKTILELSLKQVGQFAGNMLQIGDPEERPMLVMSKSARASLNVDQITILEDESDVLAVSIPVIEKHGGGSLRCMLAELFVPVRD